MATEIILLTTSELAKKLKVCRENIYVAHHRGGLSPYCEHPLRWYWPDVLEQLRKQPRKPRKKNKKKRDDQNMSTEVTPPTVLPE